MSTVLIELQGTFCVIGDSLVWTRSRRARSRRACQETEAMLEKYSLQELCLIQKNVLSKDQLKFLDHVATYIAIYN